ncbi:unnamed protein product [Lactuca saligna]|uniref:Uncharacterized protein n=1 Tax=Lactuca saligna TaxID=75948 RepID=A0AA35YSW8_LACSI|nr:unnamed protein product [Lactuca saligna]
MNIRFKGFRGVDNVLDEFTLANFPYMNPYNWISLFNIFMKDKKNYEPIGSHLKKMLICYVLDIAKMDVEIALVLQKRPILEREEEPRDVKKMKLGVIQKEHWSVAYNRKSRKKLQKSVFFLRDNHLYSTIALKTILAIVETCKVNFVVDLKCFSNMIKWYQTV